MSAKRLSFCFLFAALACSGTQAQQLVTFIDGNPAVAADVNANFATLLAEIQALKAQVAALQPKKGTAALIGTWDLFNLDGTTFETVGTTMNMENAGGEGTITFNSDGTFTSSEKTFKSSLSIANNISAPCPTCLPKSLINGYASNAADPTPDKTGNYTVNGNIVTLLGTVQATLSRSGDTIYMFQADASGIQLIILSKR